MSSSALPLPNAPDLGTPLTEERRTTVRYSPDPLVPVFFAHPQANVPTAGLLVDVSEGGCRIVAPPTARPKLHWGDPLQIIISYSESARDAKIEGLRLWAHVVRLEVDSREFVLCASFSQAGSDGDWPRLRAWVRTLGEGVR